MDKKAQGSTFWIIVTAVIALVVLLVLILIFTKYSGKTETGLIGCESKGGLCITCNKDASNVAGACNYECKQKGGSYTSIFECQQGQGCCLGIGQTT